MVDPTVSSAKRRVLELLKRLGPTDAAELANRLDLTDAAVRQHLAALAALGLVGTVSVPAKAAPRGRGRPASAWSLTPPAEQLFPDRHAELTVSLIQATRRALGQAGLDQVVATRSADQLREYREQLPSPASPLGERVEALAARRSAEGYMAEVRPDGPDGYILVEHHCPICEAARSCQGICAGELEVFGAYLGPEVTIERVSHLMADDDRCAYRIQPRR